MDVSCSRCRAEYEFDDALISERGTSVFCTACGLRFKVYPSAGRGAPEEWILTPADAPDQPVVFGTLRELQHAILDGRAGPDDLLVRGLGRMEAARPLRSFAELEPLLRRPRSAPPPPVTALQSVSPRSEEPAQRRAPGGTTMGLAAPRVPHFQAEAPPNDGAASPALADEWAGPVAPGGTKLGLSVPRAPRQAAQAPPESLPPEALATGEAEPIVPSSNPDDPDPAEQAARTPLPPAGGTPRPKIQSMLTAGTPAPASALEPTAPQGAEHRGSVPSRETTPRAERASHFDSEPFTGSRRRPGARAAWVVVVVLVGAGAFVLTTARQRILSFFQPTDPTRALALAENGASLRALDAAVDLADEAWLRARIVPDTERPLVTALLEPRLLALETEIAALSVQPNPPALHVAIARAHLLRMQGDVPAARRVLTEAAAAREADPYVLAMLDFADTAGTVRPFPAILRGLKEATLTERENSSAPVAYIVALTEAGQLEEAKAELGLWSKQAGVKGPLFGDLERYVERVQAQLSSGRL